MNSTIKPSNSHERTIFDYGYSLGVEGCGPPNLDAYPTLREMEVYAAGYAEGKAWIEANAA